MDDGSASAYSLAMGLLRLRIIALTAAYAVALQGLLSAFAPMAVALPAGVLCSGQTLDDPAAPANHEMSCTSACAVLGAAAAPPPPNVVISRQVVDVTLGSVAAPARLAAEPRGLQTARAPPSV